MTWSIQRNKQSHYVLAKDGRPVVTLNRAPGSVDLPTDDVKRQLVGRIAAAMNQFDAVEEDPDCLVDYDQWFPYLGVLLVAFFSTLIGCFVGAGL